MPTIWAGVLLIGFLASSCNQKDDFKGMGIKDGTVTGTIVQDPYQYGYQSAKVLKDILEGKSAKDFIDIPPRKVVRENVDEYWADLKAKKAG